MPFGLSRLLARCVQNAGSSLKCLEWYKSPSKICSDQQQLVSMQLREALGKSAQAATIQLWQPGRMKLERLIPSTQPRVKALITQKAVVIRALAASTRCSVQYRLEIYIVRQQSMVRMSEWVSEVS